MGGHEKAEFIMSFRLSSIKSHKRGVELRLGINLNREPGSLCTEINNLIDNILEDRLSNPGP